MSNASTRFYERNLDWLATHNASDAVTVSLETLRQRNTRYGAAVEFLVNSPNLDVVEIGCGNPLIPTVLASIVNSFTAIDIVAKRLSQTDIPNLHMILADLNDDFPVLSQTCDVVLAMMIVEHLFDPFHSFSEISRIVRPGGKVFMNLPNIGSLRCRADLLMGKLPVTSAHDWFERREWDGNHLHYFTVDSVRRISKLFELNLVAMHPVGRFGALKRLRPQLFCHEITFEFVRH